ncbi:MAG: hypothetical protein GSR81_07235 [Desulfurococcales archaeon]|nr:hypothetical protein [Desulfurococcales archaeon]
MMLTYEVELTLEAARSCKDKPTAKLLVTLLAMDPGDTLVVTGEDLYYPYQKLLKLLEAQGFEILEKDYDGLTYKIKACKT